MEEIRSWSAKRAGGRITITGKDAGGDDVKIVGVDKIEAATPYPIAVDQHGDRYSLLPPGA